MVPAAEVTHPSLGYAPTLRCLAIRSVLGGGSRVSGLQLVTARHGSVYLSGAGELSRSALRTVRAGLAPVFKPM